MLRICSLAGETLATLTTKEFEDQSVKLLKTLVAKQIGVPRFRQRWLSEDHCDLQEEAFVIASDVQLVVLEYVQAEDGQILQLFDACRKNNVDQADELLRKPLNPNVLEEDDPMDDFFETERDLIEEALGMLSSNPRGVTALHVAAEKGHVEVVRLLLEAGAKQDAVDSNGATALHRAAKRGHSEVVRLLLEAGADTGRTNDVTVTALHLAARGGHLEVVRLLLETGAKQDVVDSNGKTVLHCSAESGHLEVVRLLLEDLEAGAKQDAIDSDGVTTMILLVALDAAARRGHSEVVRLLRQAGADEGARREGVDYIKQIVRHSAAKYNHDPTYLVPWVPKSMTVHMGSVVPESP